ncbi:14074_t:CDS:1, partial [Dentiscutata heterogama]
MVPDKIAGSMVLVYQKENMHTGRHTWYLNEITDFIVLISKREYTYRHTLYLNEIIRIVRIFLLLYRKLAFIHAVWDSTKPKLTNR